jgi:chemotaxis protein methyltransferase CheR
MNADDFETLSTVLNKRSGLALTKDKSYLLESRLMRVVRQRRFNDIPQLAAAIRGKDESLIAEVVEVMTTSETLFFRDDRPFTQLRDIVLPQLKEARASKKLIRIWCAGCSSGQEPYSLAIMIKELSPEFSDWNIEIVGSDISERILKRACDGVYTQFEVQRGLPVRLLIKYFNQVETGWELDESIRSMVQFRPFNLLDSMTALGIFDVVYCRNVLNGFDHHTKVDVLSRIRSQMADDGILYLGINETVLGVSDDFKPATGQRCMYSCSGAVKKEAVG